jgi:L-threonylcarbamoyladenylate synthase
MENIIKQAAISLANGGVVCFPTETVYALAASAVDEKAVAAIYKIKGRDYNKPLSLLMPDIATARQIVKINDAALKLMEKFCPGPITFILPKAPTCQLPAFLNSGLDAVGVRIPDHKIALEILRQANCPVVATSVNPSGMPEAITAAQVKSYFGDKIDFILGDDEGVKGKASTIVDMTGGGIKVLREGVITKEQIYEVMGNLC